MLGVKTESAEASDGVAGVDGCLGRVLLGRWVQWSYKCNNVNSNKGNNNNVD